MYAFPGSRCIPIPYWVFLSVTVLLLPACATTGVGEEEKNPDAEAVDIGYGTADREHITGSTVTVRGDDKSLPEFRTLAEMLQRNVAGVRVIELPGGGISVRIRGSNSFLGGEDALIVLDGMMLQSGAGLSGLNPNDVESITVLKDAGATAIYGSRGANGVVLIKTKRGSG